MRTRLLYYNLSSDHFIYRRRNAILISVLVIKSFTGENHSRVLSTQVQWGEYK